jgi:hypothetical protein
MKGKDQKEEKKDNKKEEKKTSQLGIPPSDMLFAEGGALSARVQLDAGSESIANAKRPSRRRSFAMGEPYPVRFFSAKLHVVRHTHAFGLAAKRQDVCFRL